MMTACKGKKNLVMMVAVLLPLLLVGCTCVKYSYDIGTSFAGLKTYMWAPSSIGYGGRDPLLESNVQFLSDQILGPKGFMGAIKRHLKALGVPEKQSRYEFFGPAAALELSLIHI